MRGDRRALFARENRRHEENDSSVTPASATLTRLDALERIVHKIREKRHGVVLRVMTNGLYDVPAAIRAADLKWRRTRSV